LRFRFDKNAEAPTAAACNAVPANYTVPTVSSKIFSRINISNPISKDCTDLSGSVTAPSNPDDIVYDLKMSYRKDKGEKECIAVGQVVGCDQPRLGQPALNRDTAVEYDVSSIKGTLSLAAVFEVPIDSNTSLEIIPLNDQGNSLDSGQILSRAQNDGTVPLITLPIGAAKIRLRPFGRDLVKYSIYSSDPGDSLDSRITTVESIGYFGVSKRKLTLTLDRLTGTVSEVFDFVLFSGSGPIIGPGN
jgi:hypothetical protein